MTAQALSSMRLTVCYNHVMDDGITQKIHTPKDLENFKGKFVVFFSEESDPQVIFSSFIAEEAYKKAEEITQREKRTPVVYRVQEKDVNIAAKLSI